MSGVDGREDPAGVGTAGHPDWGAMAESAAGLLERHPEAIVAAIGGETSPGGVAVPDALVPPGHQRLGPGEAAGLVDPADVAVVARLWGEARSQGVSSGAVRRSDTGEQIHLYIFDVRRTHDVLLVVALPNTDAEVDSLVRSARLPSLPARLARVRKNGSAVLVEVDDALVEILGWTAEELVGRRMTEFVHADDLDLAIPNWLDMLAHPGPSARVRLRHLHRTGAWVWMEVTNFNRLDDPAHGDVLAEMVDISDEMAAHEALRAREQLLAQLTDTVPLGLFHTDVAGNLLYANRRFHELTGAAPGANVGDSLGRVVRDDEAALAQAMGETRRGIPADIEVRIEVDGQDRCVDLSMRPLLDDDGHVTGLTGSVEDVTDAVRARTELEARAASDPLTGCLNRTATLGALQDLLDCTEGLHDGARSATAVVFVDLDRFKPVNDRLGHAAGDELLLAVATRIRAAVRASDVVGRLGGDEFLVVCPGVPDATDAMRIAGMVASRLCSPLELHGSVVDVKASFGVAWSDSDGAGAATLVELADAAMYRSKRQGRCEPVLASIVTPR